MFSLSSEFFLAGKKNIITNERFDVIVYACSKKSGAAESLQENYI